MLAAAMKVSDLQQLFYQQEIAELFEEENGI